MISLPVVGCGFRWQCKWEEVLNLSTDQPKMSDVIFVNFQIMCGHLALKMGCTLHVEIVCMSPFINMEISGILMSEGVNICV